MDARPLGNRRRLIAAWMLLLVAACGREAVDEEVGEEHPPLPSQVTKVRELSEYRDGKLAWVFRGDELRYFEEEDQVEADGVIVDFYDEEEKHVSTLTAEHGQIDRKSSEMRVVGRVVITGEDGAMLESDSLRWENRRRIVYTDGFVTITRGKRKITGYGLETDPGLERTEIERDVIAFTVEGPHEE